MYTAEQLREFSKVGKSLKKIRNDVLSRAKINADDENSICTCYIHGDDYVDFLHLNHEKLLKLFLELGYFAEITVNDFKDREGYVGEVKLDWTDDKLASKGMIKKSSDTIFYYLEGKELKRVVDK